MGVPVVVSVHCIWPIVPDDGGIDLLHHCARHRVRRCEMSKMADFPLEQLLFVHHSGATAQSEWISMTGKRVNCDRSVTIDHWFGSFLRSVLPSEG